MPAWARTKRGAVAVLLHDVEVAGVGGSSTSGAPTEPSHRGDSNCRVIKNCGATHGYPCAQKARILDLSAADPQPPEYDEPLRVPLRQPGLTGDANQGGQWWFIDVTAFEPIAGVD